MIGLPQNELIDILNRVNRTNQISKTDLHQAIATAITANNLKLTQDLERLRTQEIQQQVERQTSLLLDQHLMLDH